MFYIFVVEKLQLWHFFGTTLSNLAFCTFNCPVSTLILYSYMLKILFMIVNTKCNIFVSACMIRSNTVLS